MVRLPLLVFWFVAFMLVYAVNRHHPNPQFGEYTPRGAPRFSMIR